VLRYLEEHGNSPLQEIMCHADEGLVISSDPGKSGRAVTAIYDLSEEEGKA
jgi:hypothetical protein